MHENSLANLRPPWRPGCSANPAGRNRGAAYVSEWINSLLAEGHDGRPMYTREQIERIADRDKSPAKVMAAGHGDSFCGQRHCTTTDGGSERIGW